MVVQPTHVHTPMATIEFCIGVWPNGLRGEFDATLQWWAKFTITLQLLNHHSDNTVSVEEARE